MRNGWLCVSITALVVASAGVGADIRAELRKEYDRYIQAYKNHDIKAIEAMATSDFKMKMAGQVFNRKQALDAFRQEFASMPKGGEASVKIGKITTKGKTAIAESVGTFRNKMKGPSGKWQTVVGSGKSRETFVKTPSGWKVRMVEQLTMTMTIDGKKVDPMTMMPPPPKPKK